MYRNCAKLKINRQIWIPWLKKYSKLSPSSLFAYFWKYISRLIMIVRVNEYDCCWQWLTFRQAVRYFRVWRWLHFDHPPPPSPLPGYNFKRMRLLLLWKIKKWEENHLKEHHILFGGFGINTMRKIIWGPCVDKRAMWDSAPWLVQVVCCNGLTMMGFNTNSVEAEGQCKRL